MERFSVKGLMILLIASSNIMLQLNYEFTDLFRPDKTPVTVRKSSVSYVLLVFSRYYEYAQYTTAMDLCLVSQILKVLKYRLNFRCFGSLNFWYH